MDGQGNANYDVFPDGKRFIMVQRADTVEEQPTIVVVQNWFDELKRLALINSERR